MDAVLQEKIENRREVLEGIKTLLVDRLQLEVEPADIDDDTFLFGVGLQLDSIDGMEVVLGVQAEFGVLIPEGDVSPLRTVNTLADYVQAQRAA
jgi:acyl carrier protein